MTNSFSYAIGATGRLWKQFQRELVDVMLTSTAFLFLFMDGANDLLKHKTDLITFFHPTRMVLKATQLICVH